jgi:hypothetical protein
LDVFFLLNAAFFLDLPFHPDVVGFAEVNLRIPDQNAIEESIETEVIFQDWVFQFLESFIEILVDALPAVRDRVLLHLTHDLYDHIQGFCGVVGIESNFELLIVVLLGVFEDVIIDRGHHFADNPKSNIEVVLISEQSHHHLLEIDVFIAVDIFGVVVGDKSTAHASDFQLEGILDKRSSYQVVVLSFETLVVPS